MELKREDGIEDDVHGTIVGLAIGEAHLQKAVGEFYCRADNSPVMFQFSEYPNQSSATGATAGRYLLAKAVAVRAEEYEIEFHL